MASRIPKTLYHYCSLPTFQKIIEGKIIWLSDISKSNDFREMKWIYDIFLDYFTEKQVAYQKEYISLLQENIKIINEDKISINNRNDKKKLLIPKYDSKQIEDFKDTTRAIQNAKIYQSYAICFSEVADSLSQWRGYADDGYGIAIGFNREHFSLFNKFKGTEIEDNFSFDKVSYSSVHAKRYIEAVSSLDKINKNSTSDEIVSIGKQAVSRISVRAAFFKSDSFKEEKEWRVAVTLPSLDYNDDYFNIRPTDIYADFKGRYYLEKFGFSSTKDRLVPHIDLKLLKIKDAISEIYIGPKSQVSIKDIQMFLIAYGLLSSIKDQSIRVFYSASSYR